MTKFKENNEPDVVITKDKDTQTKAKIQEPMPNWKKEEQCFVDAGEVTDQKTGKKAGHLQRLTNTTQIRYNQNVLDRAFNPDTGEWYPKRDENGNIVKGAEPTYLVTVITRHRVGDKEFLTTKGRFFGFDINGEEIYKDLSWPERWTRTKFSYQGAHNERTKSYEKQLAGVAGIEDVYELPFTKPNVDMLWEQTDKKNVHFVIKDENAGDDVVDINRKWGSAEKEFQLFRDKEFDWLHSANYFSPDVKRQNLIEAESKGYTKYSPTFHSPAEGNDKNQGYLA